MKSFALLAGLAAIAVAHEDHDQTPIEGPHKSLWYNTLPGDGGTQVSQTQSRASALFLEPSTDGCATARPTQSSLASPPSAASTTTRVSRTTTSSTTSPSSVLQFPLPRLLLHASS